MHAHPYTIGVVIASCPFDSHSMNSSRPISHWNYCLLHFIPFCSV